MNTPNDTISEIVTARFNSAIERLFWAQPYLAHILSGLKIRANTAITTMCVSCSPGQPIQLEWNPGWVAALTVEQTTAVLQHEANHIAFGHLAVRRELYPDKRALTIAHETAVNQFCDKGKLPGKPVLLEDWPELPEESSWQERYQILAAMPLDNDPRTNQIDWDGMKKHHPAGVMEPGDLERIFKNAVGELGPKGITKGLLGPQQAQIAKALAKRGNATGCLEELAKIADGVSQISWERRIRQLAGILGKPVPSLLRQPRRLPHLTGLVPGKGGQPHKPRVLAAIDTSGSVTSADFSLIGRELASLVDLCEISLVCCDTKITSVGKLTARSLKHSLALQGRGGTDLRPPLEPQFLARIKPRLVVYFTDGHGPIPQTPPAIPVVWVLVGANPKVPPWGESIPINSNKNRSKAVR
jgi:predicted metal-dependent peptidase